MTKKLYSADAEQAAAREAKYREELERESNLRQEAVKNLSDMMVRAAFRNIFVLLILTILIQFRRKIFQKRNEENRMNWNVLPSPFGL